MTESQALSTPRVVTDVLSMLRCRHFLSFPRLDSSAHPLRNAQSSTWTRSPRSDNAPHPFRSSPMVVREPREVTPELLSPRELPTLSRLYPRDCRASQLSTNRLEPTLARTPRSTRFLHPLRISCPPTSSRLSREVSGRPQKSALPVILVRAPREEMSVSAARSMLPLISLMEPRVLSLRPL